MILLLTLLASCAAFRSSNELHNALTSPAALKNLFSEFLTTENRHYVGQELRMRLGIFRKNLREIVEHNEQTDTPSWTMEVNMFTDMTDEERAAYTGANLTLASEDIPAYQPPEGFTSRGSDGKDWRGVAVTKVKSQGSCGSCWVFSAVAALEGAYKNKGSVLKSFSEQEGLDCSQRNGCGGGWMQRVYDYTKRSGRLSSMKTTPYRGKQYSCNYNNKPDGLISFKVSGYTNAQGDSRHVSALESSGPLSVAFTCTRKFHGYRGGIYSESNCRGGGHAVATVGYNSQAWVVKNSWGARWGVKGYVLFARGNTCGITQYGLIPTLTSTGKTDPNTDEDTDGGDDIIDDVCRADSDKNSRCEEWANRDPSECAENWTYMIKNCQTACKKCECVDLSPRCEEWKGKGYCEREYVPYMKFVCKKTCDKCPKEKCDEGYKRCPDNSCVKEAEKCPEDNDGECQEGFKKCPDGSCVHEHWTC